MQLGPREKLLVRMAVVWHLTATDVFVEGLQEVDEEEARAVEADAEKVRRILVAWLAYDKTKPDVFQRHSDRDDVERMLREHFA